MLLNSIFYKQCDTVKKKRSMAYFISGMIDLSEEIVEERRMLENLSLKFLETDNQIFRSILIDQLKDIDQEQEFYCCLKKMDLNASQDAFHNWRDFTQLILDEHMFETPYEVYIGGNSDSDIIYGHDAISLYLAERLRIRYECLKAHLEYAKELFR